MAEKTVELLEGKHPQYFRLGADVRVKEHGADGAKSFAKGQVVKVSGLDKAELYANKKNELISDEAAQKLLAKEETKNAGK